MIRVSTLLQDVWESFLIMTSISTSRSWIQFSFQNRKTRQIAFIQFNTLQNTLFTIFPNIILITVFKSDQFVAFIALESRIKFIDQVIHKWNILTRKKIFFHRMWLYIGIVFLGVLLFFIWFDFVPVSDLQTFYRVD